MAVKTFTTGEVLTAADTNTYLNNGGLVYIKSQTVGNAVASVTISNAFSADFDNYRVTYIGGAGSAAAMIRLQYGSLNTLYYGSFIGASYSASTFYGQNDNNATLHNYIGWQNTTQAVAVFDCYNPYAANMTHTVAQHVFITAGNAFGSYIAQQASSTSVTSFTLSPGGGATFTGGTVTVYGYRKA